MKLGISLVLFNEPEKRFLKFISQINEVFKHHEIIISVHENSYQSIAYPNNVLVTKFTTNMGYGGGHNSNFNVLCDFSCDRMLVANTDVSFDFSVEQLLKGHDNTIIAPVVLNNDGSNQGVTRALPDIWMKVRSFLFEYKYTYNFRENGVFTVPSISGCFFILNIKRYKNLGFSYLFDPRFFMYEEDTDLCRRLWYSRSVYVNTNVNIFHDYGKGSSVSLKLFYFHLKSIFVYFNKWGFFDPASKESRSYMTKTL